MDPTSNTLTNIQIGDIICHVENYSNGYKKEVYGLAIGERIHGGRRMIKYSFHILSIVLLIVLLVMGVTQQ